LPIALTASTAMLFEGRETSSPRAPLDETGYVQPSREDLIAARGGKLHLSLQWQKFWRVQADGTVTNVGRIARWRWRSCRGRYNVASAVAEVRGGAAADS